MKGLFYKNSSMYKSIMQVSGAAGKKRISRRQTRAGLRRQQKGTGGNMEYAAIRHFADKRYCYAMTKGHFLIRLEVKRGDAYRVILHTQNKYLPLRYMDTRQECAMSIVCSDKYIDYYEAEIDIDVVCLRYFFQIEDRSGNVVYYGNHGFYDQCITDIDRMFDCPQTLREEESFRLPAWAENKVVYQIFPSRFAADQDVAKEEWYQAPIGHKADLKGSLRGIINHFDYIRKLGVDILYMTPIFCSDSTHKYNIDDYYRIDPSFGDKEDLKELVGLAHEAGMYVILDGVFNHTGINFFAFKDIREKQEQSPYLDWYYIESLPVVAERGKRPGYKTFSYAGYMPKLNLQNPETADYVIDVAAYWIRECDIDGWRLDVADEISHGFWKRFRREMKAVKKDILLVGEIWHYAGDFLEGDEWDSVMNYPFYDSAMDLIVLEKCAPSAFWENLNFVKGNLNKCLEGYLWNMIDSHDTARFLHSAGNDIRKQKLAAALQLLLPGMPMIYYGDEVGMEGGPDPDCRRGMLWDESRQNRECLAYYRRLIQIRHRYPALTKGRITRQYADDDAGVLYMERSWEGRRVLLIFHVRQGSAALPELEGWRNLISEEPFSGSLGDYEAAMLVEM